MAYWNDMLYELVLLKHKCTFRLKVPDTTAITSQAIPHSFKPSNLNQSHEFCVTFKTQGVNNLQMLKYLRLAHELEEI